VPQPLTPALQMEKPALAQQPQQPNLAQQQKPDLTRPSKAYNISADATTAARGNDTIAAHYPARPSLPQPLQEQPCSTSGARDP
jgi:hypothetical protein